MRIEPNCLECKKPLDLNKRQYGGLCSVQCEAEYTVKMKTVKTYFKVWPESGSKNQTCTVEAHEVTSMLEDADEPYLVFPVKMTKAEFLALPEFTGF